MREDHYAVLRWLAIDDLEMMAGYGQSADECERLGWIHGWGSQRRLTVEGRLAYDREFQRRRLAGLALDTDPLSHAA